MLIQALKYGPYRDDFGADPENRAGVSPTNSATPLSFSAPTSYTVGPLSNAAARTTAVAIPASARVTMRLRHARTDKGTMVPTARTLIPRTRP